MNYYDVLFAKKLNGGGGGGGSITPQLKDALLACFSKVAWVDENGNDYYTTLQNALYSPADLSTLSAVYSGGTVTSDVPLDSLKSNLVVTATWSDSSTSTVASDYYTLSGTLTAGTSTITVSYLGKTTTFNVTVSGAELSSISAVYTQSGTVYTTDTLNSLKSDLVVTATYDDTSTATIPSSSYTLSGSLTVGTSTITVSYGGKTDTFTVTVTTAPAQPIYNWDLKNSLVDTVGHVTALTTATFTQGTGIVFSSVNKYCDFGVVFGRDRTYELDIAEIGDMMDNGQGYKDYARFLAFDTDANTSSGGASFIQSAKSGRYGWLFYKGSAWDSKTFVSGTAENDGNRKYFSGKTVKIYVDSNGYAKVSEKTIGADDSTYALLGTTAGALNNFTNGHVYIGSSTNDYVAEATFSGLRIYEGEK